jgi:hypothetical protein
MRSLDSLLKLVQIESRQLELDGVGRGGGGEKVPGTRWEVPIYPPFSSQSIEIHHLHPRALEFLLLSNQKLKTA